MTNINKRIAEWEESEFSIDDGNASKVWVSNRKSFLNSKSGGFRGYGLNIQRKVGVKLYKIIFKITSTPRLVFTKIFFFIEYYVLKIASLLILGNRHNAARWGLESWGYKNYDNALLKSFDAEFEDKGIFFSHNTLKSYSYLKSLNNHTNFIDNNKNSKINILEIGAGLFNFGHLLSIKIKKFNYVVCDLPELIQTVVRQIENEYKRTSDYEIFLPNEINSFIESKSDRKVLFITPNQIDNTKKLGIKFDLFINHESFAEMGIKTVNTYLRKVANLMSSGALLFIINRESRPQAVTPNDFKNLNSLGQLTAFENYELDFADTVIKEIEPFRSRTPNHWHIPNILYIGKVK